MKERLDSFYEIIKNATNNWSTFGIVTEIVDIIAVFVLLFILFRVMKPKFKIGKIILIFAFYCLALFASYIFNLNILFFILKYAAFWLFGLIIVVYSQEFKHLLDTNLHANANSATYSSGEERSQIIDTLVNTAVYLSERKTGALITIEGNESLDSLINKSILIKSVINQELLTSLFYVGTATHDGAVIIRRNRIMCAGAYLPSTDRYDIPKSLGTRHRAAIGISEKCDAITIVVSEETGNISVTMNGGIEIGITSTALRELLEQHLVMK